MPAVKQAAAYMRRNKLTKRYADVLPSDSGISGVLPDYDTVAT